MKNNYPSGIITPTSIIPLVFYARDNYPEFFPTTLGEDVCWLGFQRKLSSRRSGILSIPRDCRHEGPTSAAMPRRSVPCRPESLAGQNCAALRRAAPGLWNATKPPCPRAAPCRAAAMCPPIAAPATRATTAAIQNCPCGLSLDRAADGLPVRGAQIVQGESDENLRSGVTKVPLKIQAATERPRRRQPPFPP